MRSLALLFLYSTTYFFIYNISFYLYRTQMAGGTTHKITWHCNEFSIEKAVTLESQRGQPISNSPGLKNIPGVNKYTFMMANGKEWVNGDTELNELLSSYSYAPNVFIICKPSLHQINWLAKKGDNDTFETMVVNRTDNDDTIEDIFRKHKKDFKDCSFRTVLQNTDKTYENAGTKLRDILKDFEYPELISIIYSYRLISVRIVEKRNGSLEEIGNTECSSNITLLEFIQSTKFAGPSTSFMVTTTKDMAYAEGHKLHAYSCKSKLRDLKLKNGVLEIEVSLTF